MSEQFYSQNWLVGDGETTVWGFSFAGARPDAGDGTQTYLDESDVYVDLVDYVDGLATRTPANFQFGPGPAQVTVEPPIPDGQEFVIYRSTPVEFPITDYTDFAQLSENDLDRSARQSLFAAQEALDITRSFSFTASEQLASDVVALATTVATDVAEDALDSKVSVGGVGLEVVTTGTGTQTVAGALDQRVVHVDTIADLLALDTSGLVDGQVVMVKEYFLGSGSGGGEFFWDAGFPKTQADGGLVIDPENVAGFDGTVDTRDDFIMAQGSGTGYGCFIRVVKESSITPEEFGAAGVSDDYIPIQRALDAPVSTVLLLSDTYLIGGTLFTNKPTKIIFGGNTKLVPVNDVPIIESTYRLDMSGGSIRVDLSDVDYTSDCIRLVATTHNNASPDIHLYRPHRIDVALCGKFVNRSPGTDTAIALVDPHPGENINSNLYQHSIKVIARRFSVAVRVEATWRPGPENRGGSWMNGNTYNIYADECHTGLLTVGSESYDGFAFNTITIDHQAYIDRGPEITPEANSQTALDVSTGNINSYTLKPWDYHVRLSGNWRVARLGEGTDRENLVIHGNSEGRVENLGSNNNISSLSSFYRNRFKYLGNTNAASYGSMAYILFCRLDRVQSGPNIGRSASGEYFSGQVYPIRSDAGAFDGGTVVHLEIMAGYRETEFDKAFVSGAIRYSGQATESLGKRYSICAVRYKGETFGALKMEGHSAPRTTRIEGAYIGDPFVVFANDPDLTELVRGSEWDFVYERNALYLNDMAVLSGHNTVVDSNGFVKEASPVIKLYSDRIEKTGDMEISGAALEVLGVGVYRINGVPPLSREGWYIETPKDRNNNIYFTLDYEEGDGYLLIRTYEPLFNGGRSENGEPKDIVQGRYVCLRFESDVDI